MTVTELQKSLWETIGHESATTEKIRNRALQYYIEYRQHLKETHSFIESQNKIQTLFLIAYFISEKSETVYDLQGNKISNVAFSINQLAKKHSDYKEFFYHLKEMMRKVTLPSEAKESEEEINSFVKYFSFLMTFYNKFLSTFDKITICHNIPSKDLEALGGEKEYKDKIKCFLWVVYISFRKAVFKNSMDTIGNTCLLALVFGYFIEKIYDQEKITSIYAPQIAQQYGTFPNQYEEIHQVWLSYFCLKDLKTYQQVRKIFIQYVQNLATKLPDMTHPFSPKSIFFNVKKLQEIYHRSMEMHHIDETLLLSNLMSNQENIRFTAFGAKRKIAKLYSNNIIQCKRTLNYDAEIKKQQETSKKEPNFPDKLNSQNYLEVIKKVKASQTPTILIQATPVNQFTVAYNWLFGKSQAHAQDQVELNLQQLLEMGYKRDSYQLGNNYVLEKRKLIEGLFGELIHQFGDKTQQNINVASILALEVFYYVMNITNREITEIVENLCVSWFAIWKGVDTLLNYDRTMPSNIKTHLLLLETSIVSSLIWKDEEFIEVLTDSDFAKDCPEFFYRVLHHIAYQVNFIGKAVNLPETLMDQSFIVCQFFMKECIVMMQSMNLDVIIMCSIYGVCRAKNTEIKFKSIISAYKDVNSMDDKTFQIIDTLQIGDGENYNIINFYNKVFLKNCKSILMKIKEERLQNDQIINSSNYVLSPVKSILPSGLQYRTNPQGTPTNVQMLFAYNESPLLNRNKKINTNQTPSKDKCEENKNMGRRTYNENDVLRERSTNISEMIEKKFGNGKASTLVAKGHRLKQQV